jgi:eukaryotic-like serine/threonine-protein kinase
MGKSISFNIVCLLALTPSLYSTEVPSLKQLTLSFTINQALSNNKFLQELIKPEAERELPTLPSEQIEELKQTLLDTYKLPLIDLFKDYSVKIVADNINLITFSSDGTKILIASDNIALIWDLAEQGPTSIELKGHTGSITSVAISKDRTKALTGYGDQTARLWDAKTGKLLAILQGHVGDITLVGFSPDGDKAFTASNGPFQLWDITSKEQPPSIVLQDHRIQSAAFSLDGKKLLTGSADGTVQLWDITNKEQPPLIVLQGHNTSAVSSVALSPDGNNLLTGFDNGTVCLWDAATGNLIAILEGHTETITSVAFSLDGKKALTGSWDNTARLLDITKEQPTSMVLKGHTGAIGSAVFSPDITKALTGSWDTTARLWDITKQQPTSIEFKQPVSLCSLHSVAFSPNGRHVLTRAWVWDLVEPMASLTLAQLLIILKLNQNPQDITNQSYRAVYETLSPEIKAYLQRTLNLPV